MSFGWYDRVLAIPYREWRDETGTPTEEWRELAEQTLGHVVAGRAPTLTRELLTAAVPDMRKPVDWLDPLNDALYEFAVSDPAEIAVLLAQLGHESTGFNRLEENLNYSLPRLRAVWPSRFPTVESARPYANNPRALAMHVYGSRLGNKIPEHGWIYRGRGLIMLTGLENYTRCSNGIGEDLVNHPERLLLPEVATRAALWYWDTRVNYPRDIERSTRDINGGMIGIEDRRRRWRIASVALGGMR